DGLAVEELACSQILTNDVIGNLLDIPLGVRGWSVPLVGANTVHGPLSSSHRFHVELARSWSRHDRSFSPIYTRSATDRVAAILPALRSAGRRFGLQLMVEHGRNDRVQRRIEVVDALYRPCRQSVGLPLPLLSSAALP